MKEIARFNMGSKYFFDKMDEYVSKDNDILVIMDDWKLTKTNVLNLKDKKKGLDVFFYKNMSKDEFIEDTLESNVPMRCGKFLIKEFCDYIGFNIEDLEKLDSVFENMDQKHIYEVYIYNCFLDNGKFELTDQQRKEAYEIYKDCKNI